jgi:excinuclease ABC subunit B
VLVGINLLREGLDLPEVSLIAVLDADKQGFLRSKSALMQVAGRAARNINGRVILFGDQITEAMQHLIDETDRRRSIQRSYNDANNITPKTILKTIDQISLSTSVADERENEMIKAIDSENININFENLDKIEMDDVLLSLGKKMKRAAKEMKFELAAVYRDKINEIKQGAKN